MIFFNYIIFHFFFNSTYRGRRGEQEYNNYNSFQKIEITKNVKLYLLFLKNHISVAICLGDLKLKIILVLIIVYNLCLNDFFFQGEIKKFNFVIFWNCKNLLN